MGNSIIGRYAVEFEAANIGKGRTPKRDIRKERRTAEEKKARQSHLSFLYREKQKERFIEEHGMEPSEYNRIQREKEWAEFIGEAPILEDDEIHWSYALKKARAAMRRHGEQEGLPETNSKYFSYWMRRELLYMRGSPTQGIQARDWSYVDYMEDIRIKDGAWEYSIVVRVSRDPNAYDYGNMVGFLEYFDQEALAEGYFRVWLPFGLITTNKFRYLINIRRSKDQLLNLVAYARPRPRVRTFFNLHHLEPVKGDCGFVHTTKKFIKLSANDKRDKQEVAKLNKLNKLWK